MKKILFIFLTVFIFVNSVKASEWQEDFLEGENVETEYRYQFYKETIEGKYVRKGINTDYQYEDTEDIKYSDYSAYQNSCLIDEGYEITYATKYLYQEILPVQFIKITNLSNRELDIADIIFMENKNDYMIGYEIYGCTNCTNDNYTINPSGSLILEMEYSVNLRDLTFELEFFDNGNTGNYELVYSYKEDFLEKDLVALVKGNVDTIKYYYNDSFKLYPNYTSVYTDYDIMVDDFIKVNTKEEVCITREIMTFRYNIINEYYDDNYYKDVSELVNLTEVEQQEYKKDLEKYKIYYRYIDDQENLEQSNIKNLNNDLNTDNLELVKTGIENKNLNYNYLIVFILSLLLISLILIKHIKTMSNENGD